MAKLTTRLLGSLRFEGKGRVLYDDDLPGFFARVGRRGIFFGVRYGPRHARRWTRIGRWGDALTVDQARTLAVALLGQATKAAAGVGVDPVAEKRAARTARKPTTWGEWSAEYVRRLDARKDLRRPEEAHRYLLGEAPKKHLSRHVPAYAAIRERWARLPLADLTPEVVERERLRLVARRPVAAIRWGAAISAALAEAVRAGLIPANPCARLKKLPEPAPRSRVFSAEELERLARAVAEEEDRFLQAGLLVCMTTGCRASEVARAKWSDLDLQAGELRLPRPKSKKPEVLFLPRLAVEVLDALPRWGALVLAGGREGAPRSLSPAWRRAVQRAGVPDARLHDVRRSVLSAIARAHGAAVAARVGRHDLSVSGRHYVHPDADALRAAVEGVAAVLPFPRQEKGA